MTYELSDDIRIDATPEAVYAVISDVTRTGEWSEQCRRVEWENDARGVGARFTGHNETPEREWTTTSQVAVADPAVEFAWDVVPAEVRWSYRMEREGDGTRLTHSTTFTEQSERTFAERFGDDARAQAEKRRLAAREGIGATLARIKDIVEAGSAR